MNVKLLTVTRHHLEILSLKGGFIGSSRLSLHLSKCHIVGNHMPWLICCECIMSGSMLFAKIKKQSSNHQFLTCFGCSKEPSH